MAAKKKKAAKEPTRLLSETKVKRVLDAMGVDATEFVNRYEATGRVALTDEERAAAKKFLEDKDWETYVKAIGSPTKADTVLRKVYMGG